MKLTPWGDTVLEKWKQSKPNLVKQLREKGRLKEVVDDLGDRVMEDVIAVKDRLREQHPNKGVGTEDYLKAVQRENEIAQQAKEVVFQSHGLNEPESEETTESVLRQRRPSENQVLSPEPGEISKRSGPSNK